MPDRTWKARERQVAALFGSKRLSYSGSYGESGGDDVLHKTLFIEVKYRKSHEAIRMYREEVEKPAMLEGKRPVLVICRRWDATPFVVLPLDRESLLAVANALGGKDATRQTLPEVSSPQDGP